MDKFSLPDIIKNKGDNQFNALKKCNDHTMNYGLALSDADINELIQTANKALDKSGRIEVNGNVLELIIEAFASSPFLSQDNYLETMESLVDIFYLYKNETMDYLSDDELIDIMKQYFNGYCKGSLELLEGKVLYTLADNIRRGNKEFTMLSLDEGEE